jgi:hypothetical protein|eukprot:COSAG01_NODE_408_length_17382_cov_6.231431_15_plen_145_part_00
MDEFLLGIVQCYTLDGGLIHGSPRHCRQRHQQLLLSSGAVEPASASPASADEGDGERAALFSGRATGATASRAYSASRQQQRQRQQQQQQPAASQAVAEASQRVRRNLEELRQLSSKADDMASNSQQFASMATQARKKKQFGFF